MITNILWLTYYGFHNIYKIYSNKMRTEYYLYINDKKIKTSSTPEDLNKYIDKIENKTIVNKRE